MMQAVHMSKAKANMCITYVEQYRTLNLARDTATEGSSAMVSSSFSAVSKSLLLPEEESKIRAHASMNWFHQSAYMRDNMYTYPPSQKLHQFIPFVSIQNLNP